MKSSDNERMHIPIKQRIIPIIVAIIILLFGIVLNIILIRLTEDPERLFIIGNITPQIMAKTIYIMWTIGAIALPFTIYNAFYEGNKLILAITCILELIVLITCIYLGAVSEARCVGSDVIDYKVSTDGVHKLYIQNMKTDGDFWYESFYIQTSKYYATWQRSGTQNADIVWQDDKVSILVNGNEIFFFPIEDFYSN